MPKKEASIRIPESMRKIKNIIGIFSAKGGVGKSEISLNIALSLQLNGYKVGLVDADIYGPSLPILLESSSDEIEIKDKNLLNPLVKKGIKFISMGLIAKNSTPVIWRGPMVSGAVMQLLSQTNWGELDYLIIDTPPGTGDIQLTLLQKMPLDATIVITTPQEVSLADTKKGVEMIKKLEVPILGMIENMSFFEPKDSDKKYFLFGKNGGKKLAKECQLEFLSEIPFYEKDDFLLTENKDLFNDLCIKVVEKLKGVKKNSVQTIPQTNT